VWFGVALLAACARATTEAPANEGPRVKPSPGREFAPKAEPAAKAEAVPKTEPVPPIEPAPKRERALEQRAQAAHDSPTHAAPTSSVPVQPAACGEKGQPQCPLQAWMERNLQRPLDAGDTAKVASGLAHVAKLVPDPGWNAGPQGWFTLTRTAEQAAQRGDVALLQRACKACHKAWRRQYRADFRHRALPE
jgi:hypothetical protein